MSIRRALLTDLPLLCLSVTFALTALVLSATTGYPRSPDWLASFRLLRVFIVIYLLGALVIVLAHTIVVEHEHIWRTATWRQVAARFFAPERILNFLTVVLALGLLMPAFIAFKKSIPDVSPFAWDPRFATWDRAIHFGRQPYEWLQPLAGHPLVTKFLDGAYALWVHIMWITLIWQAWHGDRTRPSRQQYLLAFGMSWILIGAFAATALSSAGPMFYGQVTGLPDPFAPLLAYLERVDASHVLSSQWARRYLWAGYAHGEAITVGGISAMPSMHVAIVTLQTLLGFSLDRRLGWAYAVFAFLILVGSVHLGWHYAIDGYVSIVAILFIWWLSGRVTGWWRRRSAAR